MLTLLFAALAIGAEPIVVSNVRSPSALTSWGLTGTVWKDALRAHAVARAEGHTRSNVLTVIDFTVKPDRRRLWVVDLDSGQLLFHEHVAHGKNSGWGPMTSWSNTEDSKQSSIGVSVAAESYEGKHGKSLKLDGLEPGFNDNNRKRAIVIHGASYVSQAFADEHGRVGNSWGCPAVDNEVSGSLIDTIMDGGLVVSWYDDATWRAQSRFLR